MSLVIDPKLHRQFKMTTAARGEKMTEVIVRLIDKYVKEHLRAESTRKKGGRK